MSATKDQNGDAQAKTPEAFARGDHQQSGDDRGDGKGKDQPKQEKKPFWKRPVLLIVMIVVAATAIIGGTIYLIHTSHFESTDDAFIDGRITHIAPRVAGKVLELKVTDNQLVSATDPLIVIDPQPFKVKLDQAIASQGQAEAQQAQAASNVQVAQANADQADADVVVAQANALNAEQDYQRFNKIDPAARSKQQLDSATASQRSTAAQVTSAVKKADAMHAMVQAAEKTREAAKASVEAAKSQVEQANLDLSYTTVVAGHAGRVTRRTVEVGNYVSVGQEIMDVVPTDVPDDIWVTANFKETQLAKMQRGQQVNISVDAYPDEKFTGHVDSIQNGSGAVFSLLPAENATGNFVKVVQRVPVKIVIDGHPRHMLSPGLSVEPEVDVTQHGNGDLNDTNAPPAR